MPTTQTTTQALRQGFIRAATLSGALVGAASVADVFVSDGMETRNDNDDLPKTFQEACGDIAFHIVEGVAISATLHGGAQALGRPGQPHKIARAIGFGTFFGVYDMWKTRPWTLPRTNDSRFLHPYGDMDRSRGMLD